MHSVHLIFFEPYFLYSPPHRVYNRIVPIIWTRPGNLNSPSWLVDCWQSIEYVRRRYNFDDRGKTVVRYFRIRWTAYYDVCLCISVTCVFQSISLIWFFFHFSYIIIINILYCCFESRQTYQKVKANRHNRLRIKNRKRKPDEMLLTPTPTACCCPVCNEPVAATSQEQMNAHVEMCLRNKVGNRLLWRQTLLIQNNLRPFFHTPTILNQIQINEYLHWCSVYYD